MQCSASRTVLALVIGAASASASAPVIAAQTARAVVVGSRVRVRTLMGDTARTVIGKLTAWEGDTIEVRPPAAAELRVPLANVARLDVSRGKGVVPSHVIIGACVGTVAGALVGGAIGYDSCQNCFISSLTTVTGMVVGGLIGGVGGTLVGVVIKGERWRRVPLDAPRVGVVPVRDGMAVVLSGRF